MKIIEDLIKMLLSLLFKNAFKRTTVSQKTESLVKTDWKKVEGLLKTGGPSNFKQALITADRALDNSLRDVFPGESMGERLKAAKDRFDPTTYNKIWEAHKIRNASVHEAGFEPPYYVVQRAVESLKEGILELGVRL